jgi:hypothetical protein
MIAKKITGLTQRSSIRNVLAWAERRKMMANAIAIPTTTPTI